MSWIPSFARPTLLLALAAAPLHAQTGTARVTVLVLDDATGEPVPSATVELAGVRQAGRTGGGGVWRSGRVPAGNRIVEVSRLGYERARVAIEVPDSGEVERTVRLTPAAVEVSEVAARVERRSAGLEARGFYERQRRGFGGFVTHERIEQLRPTRTVDLFYHVRGFTVRRDRQGRPYVVTNRGGANLSGDCVAPLVFLDGTLVGGNVIYLDFIQPESIGAIEAYAGPSAVPAEFRLPGAACGVILLWTRSGDER